MTYFFLFDNATNRIRNTASFVYAIALLYAISDLDAVVNSSASFPLAEAYIQGTQNKGAAFGLLLIIALAIFCGLQGVYITVRELYFLTSMFGSLLSKLIIVQCGRILWALARDNVIPFSDTFSQVSPRLSCPVPATILVCESPSST